MKKDGSLSCKLATGNWLLATGNRLPVASSQKQETQNSDGIINKEYQLLNIN
jgi:hypothetical protein